MLHKKGITQIQNKTKQIGKFRNWKRQTGSYVWICPLFIHIVYYINRKLPAYLLLSCPIMPPNLQQIQYKLYIQSQTQFPSVHLFSLSTPGGRFSHRFHSIIISANKLSPYVIAQWFCHFSHFTFGYLFLSLFTITILALSLSVYFLSFRCCCIPPLFRRVTAFFSCFFFFTFRV